MKEFKAVKPGWAGHKAHQPQFAQQTPPRAEAAMQTDAPIRKAAGRLSREDQRRLGDILQRVYDDVIQQGVPDRFKELLNELDDAGDTEKAKATTASSHEHGRGTGEDTRDSARLVGAKGLDSPGGKGSH
jgi:hypothetical protein